jgi:hydrogenase expression/formation protein HypC
MDDEVAMAKVDFGGLTKRVCVAHVPEVVPGEYVLVHVGFALARIDEAEAKRTFELLEELKLLDVASPEVDATASHEVDATASPEVDATASNATEVGT